MSKLRPQHPHGPSPELIAAVRKIEEGMAESEAALAPMMKAFLQGDMAEERAELLTNYSHACAQCRRAAVPMFARENALLERHAGALAAEAANNGP